jgi:hypothetical protein
MRYTVLANKNGVSLTKEHEVGEYANKESAREKRDALKNKGYKTVRVIPIKK